MWREGRIVSTDFADFALDKYFILSLSLWAGQTQSPSSVNLGGGWGWGYPCLDVSPFTVGYSQCIPLS